MTRCVCALHNPNGTGAIPVVLRCKRSNKRRRFDEPGSDSLRITDLPDVLIKSRLSFVGAGHYRFVAGTCRRFEKLYPFAKKSTWKSAAACAKLCLKDDHDADESDVMRRILKSAASMGQMQVIQWGYHIRPDSIDENVFVAAGAGGHTNVLEWGESKGMEWVSSHLSEEAAAHGHVPVLRWIKQHVPSTQMEQILHFL